MFGLGSNTIRSFVQRYLWNVPLVLQQRKPKAEERLEIIATLSILEVAEGGDGFPGKLAMPKLATAISAHR